MIFPEIVNSNAEHSTEIWEEKRFEIMHEDLFPLHNHKACIDVSEVQVDKHFQRIKDCKRNREAFAHRLLREKAKVIGNEKSIKNNRKKLQSFPEDDPI